jgi:membrane dipeptidase
VYAICPSFRNLKDEQILAVGKNGGVIQLNFYSGFVDSTFKTKEAAFVRAHRAEIDSLRKGGMQMEYAVTVVSDKYSDEVQAARPPMSLLLQHLDYIVRMIGVDHVGLGSDFDGINSAPQHLDDVTSYSLITKALRDKGYSRADVTKIMGGNLLRVMKANSK